jgi:hypothetical protein
MTSTAQARHDNRLLRYSPGYSASFGAIADATRRAGLHNLLNE